MIRYEVVLTNEEVELLAPKIERMRAELAERMISPSVREYSHVEATYAALMKLFRPALYHRDRLRETKRGK